MSSPFMYLRPMEIPLTCQKLHFATFLETWNLTERGLYLTDRDVLVPSRDISNSATAVICGTQPACVRSASFRATFLVATFLLTLYGRNGTWLPSARTTWCRSLKVSTCRTGDVQLRHGVRMSRPASAALVTRACRRCKLWFSYAHGQVPCWTADRQRFGLTRGQL